MKTGFRAAGMARVAALPVAILVAALLAASAPADRASTPDLSRLVGQSILTGMDGTRADPTMLRRIRRGEVGGIILFGGNIASPGALRTLVASLQAAAARGGNPPLLIAVDQEGGPVRRLPAGPPVDSAAAMGGADDAAAVRSIGGETARYLRRHGVDVDLAPVADVPDSAGSFLGSRAFARSPPKVASLATAFAAGLQSGRVAATAKHFPGLGTARANTDVARVVVHSTRSELDRRLEPFRSLIGAGVRMVMVSNAAYPAYDGSRAPALFSERIVRGLLRGTLGFRGVVVTDSLEAPFPRSTADAPARALAAGVDLLLYTSERRGAAGYARLLADARARPQVRRDVAASYARIRALKRWLSGSRGS
jgi:beta-N-acetylhexosaminidase